MNAIPPKLDVSYRALFEAHPRPMWVYDRETLAFLAVNDAALQTYGYSRDEFLAMTIKDIRPPEDIPALLDDIARLTQGVDAPDLWRHRRKDGTLIAVEITSHPIQFDDRQARLVLVIDVTERQRAIQTLERQRRAAEHLASTAQLLAQSLDPQEVAQRIVDSVRELLQARSATLFEVDPATGDFRVRTVAGDARPAFVPRMLLPAGTGVAGLAIRERRPVVTANLLTDPHVVFSPETRARIAQAPYRAVLAVPLVSHDQVTGALGVTDQEGRRFTPEEIELVQSFAHQATTALNNASLYEKTQRAYRELTRTQEQLTQAKKMEAVGQLAGGVAHDFNNLLTVITGRAQLLLMGLGPSDPARRDLELIQHAANRAAALTQQLLAYGRKQTLQPQVLDLNARVTHLSLMLRRLIGEDIALVTTLDPTLKRVKVDPGQFDQVLLNLAVNARDAMPQGGRLAIDTANVTLQDTAARQHPQVLHGAYVRLSVRDTGVGMDTETQSHLFEPFFTTKGLGKGTGLGLATVYGIVTQSGGAIGVDSAPGQGATFTIYLPPADEEPEDQTSAAS